MDISMYLLDAESVFPISRFCNFWLMSLGVFNCLQIMFRPSTHAERWHIYISSAPIKHERCTTATLG